ncbi:MAG: hypothetical protein ABUT20_35675 [Bacteroidota bacterium]
MIDFLSRLIQFFNQYNIPYMLSGSVALSIYTMPRHTKDFDFVVHLNAGDAVVLANHFKEGYYCDEDAVAEAIRYKSMFNIIDYQSGYKADFIVLKKEKYRQEEFLRRKEVDFMDMKIYVVSAEDLLISKIIWIQQLESDIQKEDIKEISKTAGLDWAYINHWISSLKLNTFGLIK